MTMLYYAPNANAVNTLQGRNTCSMPWLAVSMGCPTLEKPASHSCMFMAFTRIAVPLQCCKTSFFFPVDCS